MHECTAMISIQAEGREILFPVVKPYMGQGSVLRQKYP